jgi:uncharacterized protein (DUF58 family)
MILAFFTLIFQDFLILLATLILLTLLTYDILTTIYTSRTLDKKLFLQPSKIEVRTIAGKPAKIEIKTILKNRMPAKIILESPLPNSKTTTQAIKPGETKIEIEFQSQLADIYKTEKLPLEIIGPLKLVETTTEIPIQIEVKVYPRVVAAIIAALEYLVSTTPTPGLGIIPVKIKGPGLEYMETREYLPGDEMKRMDWKATARLGKLMIKDYHLEGIAAIHIIYDATAQTPLEKDQLATTLINMTLTAAKQEIPTALTIHNQKQIKLHTKPTNPQQILKIALKYSLETTKTTTQTIFELIEPATRNKIKTLLKHIDTELQNLKKFLEAELQALQHVALKQPYKTLTKILYEMPENTNHTIITTLNTNIIPLLEFAENVKTRNQKVTIIQPTQPWLHQKTLEEAYKTYQQYQKTLKTLQKHQITIHTTNKTNINPKYARKM